MASFRILFGLDIYFEHNELSRRFKSSKEIMKQKYRAHIQYVKVREFFSLLIWRWFYFKTVGGAARAIARVERQTGLGTVMHLSQQARARLPGAPGKYEGRADWQIQGDWFHPRCDKVNTAQYWTAIFRSTYHCCCFTFSWRRQPAQQWVHWASL